MAVNCGDSCINHLLNLLFTGIGGFIGYFSAISVSDRKEFQKAALNFREAFLDIILIFDPRCCCVERDGKEVSRILKDSFPQHIKAMLRFKPHLPYWKRREFEKAWYEYCHYQAKPGQPTYEGPFLEQYLGTDGKLALDRIHKLLKFSEIAHKAPFDI